MSQLVFAAIGKKTAIRRILRRS